MHKLRMTPKKQCGSFRKNASCVPFLWFWEIQHLLTFSQHFFRTWCLKSHDEKFNVQKKQKITKHFSKSEFRLAAGVVARAKSVPWRFCEQKIKFEQISNSLPQIFGKVHSSKSALKSLIFKLEKVVFREDWLFHRTFSSNMQYRNVD